jgi:predicted RNase H-like nuclease
MAPSDGGASRGHDARQITINQDELSDEARHAGCRCNVGAAAAGYQHAYVYLGPRRTSVAAAAAWAAESEARRERGILNLSAPSAVWHATGAR